MFSAYREQSGRERSSKLASDTDCELPGFKVNTRWIQNQTGSHWISSLLRMLEKTSDQTLKLPLLYRLVSLEHQIQPRQQTKPTLKHPREEAVVSSMKWSGHVASEMAPWTRPLARLLSSLMTKHWNHTGQKELIPKSCILVFTCMCVHSLPPPSLWIGEVAHAFSPSYLEAEGVGCQSDKIWSQSMNGK